MKKQFSFLVYLYGACFLFGACGGGTPPPPVTTRFSVSSSAANATAGTAFNITVSAVDNSGSIVGNYAGTVHFTSSDPQAALPSDSALTNGMGSFPVTMKTAGSQTITATSGSISGSSSAIAVAAGAAAKLAVAAPGAAPVAGTAFNITVSAVDGFNNVATGYSGTVQFSSTDPQATLPGLSQLTKGTGSFAVTLKTAGNQTVSATETANVLAAGTSNVATVSPAATDHFNVTGPPTASMGVSATIQVNPTDSFGNIVSSYSGTVHFSSTDTKAALPADAPLVVPFTVYTVTFNTAGTQTVTVTDTAKSTITGKTGSVNVVSNAATHFSVNGPSDAPTRQTFNFTVSALDVANNVSLIYNGTVHFSSTDSKAMLPANSTLTAGTANFSATMETTGTQTLTATDTAAASLNGASTINVTAAPALTITSSAPPDGTYNVVYGQVVRKTVTVECRRVFPGQVSCVPCGPGTSIACTGPTCNLQFSFTPCHTTQTRLVFQGFTFTATGGIGALTWSASSLPPGLTVDPPTGEILGTPTSPGTYNISATVTDSGLPPVQTTANYSMKIALPAAPVVNTTPAPPPGVVNQPYNYTFTASGAAPLTWSETGALPNGLAFNNNTGQLSGTPTAVGSFPITVTATDQFKQASAGANFTIVVSQHGFVPAGNMTTPRDLHTATLLGTAASSKVLLAGGHLDSVNLLSSAELFDSATGSLTATGSMTIPRAAHSATLLTSGKVLIAGGQSGSPATVIATAELYDPTAGTFAATGSMKTARYGHAAIPLGNGSKVLLIGGADSTGKALGSAEIFDSSTGTFSATGSMHAARTAFTATLLANGKVLVAGGIDANATHLSSAELFDPSNGTFTVVPGIMTVTRASHTATLLSDAAGTVLIAGGVDDSGNARNTAELFNPAIGSFSATSNMGTAHSSHSATLLPDGTVLIAGGTDSSGSVTASAEVFNLTAGSFAPTGSLVTARERHTATLLNDGRLLVTGGSSGTSALGSAELYQ